MEALIVISLVVNLGLCFLVSNWASKLSLSFSKTFLISLFLSPIFGVMYILVFKDNDIEKVKNKEETKIKNNENKITILASSIILIIFLAMVYVIINK